MNETLEQLIKEKMEVVLGRIRTNSSADEALKYTQGFVNLVSGYNQFYQQGVKQRTKGTGT